jgi:putative sterol carrier protein
MAADTTTEFFESLGRRAHEPLLEQTVGTLRFDLARKGDVDHWFVAIDKGDLAVSHQRRRADCTVRAPKQLFGRVASGEVNATAAVLRGALEVEGDAELLTLFQRLFPGPPAGRNQQRSGEKP